MKDKKVEKLIQEEEQRQLEGIELIASENYVSSDVYKALGSVFTNKYAEGYPGKRYYGGCKIVDEVEQLAIDRACKLFGCEYANVQPHSGSQANRAVIEAVCEPGDTILSLDLDSGGHLTHGSPVSFSGKYYNIINYHTGDDGYINYEELINLARQYKPKLIIAGASAYSREWDYIKLAYAKTCSISVQKVSAIQTECAGASCILMFDMAHIAGLVAANLVLNPCIIADIVTCTTHKTLRGPRGGLILMKNDFNYKGKMMSKLLNSSIFPGNQGGPLENTIAAKAVCFYEAGLPEFKEYQEQVLQNSKFLALELQAGGLKIVSGGTDNHSFLVDLRTKYPNLTGKQAEAYLELAGITVNKNMIPNDSRSPLQTSGLRIGTPAITSRGITDMKLIAGWILKALELKENAGELREEIKEYALKFPLRYEII